MVGVSIREMNRVFTTEKSEIIMNYSWVKILQNPEL